jgi:hypothetical protein
LAALVPVVTSIVAPTPAMAAGSCKSTGQPCSSGVECCSTACNGITSLCI